MENEGEAIEAREVCLVCRCVTVDGNGKYITGFCVDDNLCDICDKCWAELTTYQKYSIRKLWTSVSNSLASEYISDIAGALEGIKEELHRSVI